MMNFIDENIKSASNDSGTDFKESLTFKKFKKSIVEQFIQVKEELYQKMTESIQVELRD